MVVQCTNWPYKVSGWYMISEMGTPTPDWVASPLFGQFSPKNCMEMNRNWEGGLSSLPHLNLPINIHLPVMIPGWVNGSTLIIFHWRFQRAASDECPPLGPLFMQYCAVFEKNSQHNILVYPSVGLVSPVWEILDPPLYFYLEMLQFSLNQAFAIANGTDPLETLSKLFAVTVKSYWTGIELNWILVNRPDHLTSLNVDDITRADRWL